MKRRILAIIISLTMILSYAFPVFGETSADIAGSEENSAPVLEENVTLSDSGISTQNSEESTGNTDQNADEPSGADEVDASKWTSEDFTYGSYEKWLYGCDYTRQITIKGVVITGFSDNGKVKLEKNKDLVIPAEDDDGYAIVGIGEKAFYKTGLTSVTFPTGMMVDYDDTVTNGKITKRGNFIIADNAFSGNDLTSVTLPEGVIAVLSNAFSNNKIETVKLPKSIWWLETMSFAKNRITTVNFPTTCDFQLEMHGMVFAKNFIKSVRLPDYTEVVNKEVFFLNLGKEPIADDAKDNYKKYTVDGQSYNAGVVYMYADNAELEEKDRIHHTGKLIASQQSYVQKLVINDGTAETQNSDSPWNINDFIIEGTVIKGLSDSGIAKRATNKDLMLPDYNKEGKYITEIAAAAAGGNGLFASADEKIDSVYLPTELKTVGDFVFQNSGLKEITFPYGVESIGTAAFQRNNLTSVILPDTVTSLGGGAFGTNPKLERISLSKGLTAIPAGAFGCSDNKNWMENLTGITLHEGIISIGDNAFAGNNFTEITIPSSVISVGNMAFSTKNYLETQCKVTLNEGLVTIGSRAFRNKVISEITLPTTVTKLDANTFEKKYSDGSSGVVTKVYVSLQSQYDDAKSFPTSHYHKLYLTDISVWTAEDFTYGEQSFAVYTPMADYSSTPNFENVNVITGFSEQGETKLALNKNLVIPAKDPNGNTVQGIGDKAFYKKGIENLILPENIKTAWDSSKLWSNAVSTADKRGDFFIGANAFLGNKLTTLELPEGVLYVGGSAFKSNALTTVKFPKTILQICNQSFAGNAIVSLAFDATTDFPLQIDMGAFGLNRIQAVQLPSNLEKLDKNTFLKNTNAEGTVIKTKVYIDAESYGANVQTSSSYHEIKGTDIPDAQAPWGVEDFVYNEAGSMIIGLSESGQAKIKVNPVLVIPKMNSTGDAIIALGDGVNNKGIFVVQDDENTYTPSSVLLPSTLKKIGKCAFALGSADYAATMTSIVFPDGLEEIGAMAFQNSKLKSVSLPNSLTTLGQAAFTGSTEITAIKLSANVTEIPANAFANGGMSLSKFGTLEIPEGVVSIGASAFAGRHIKEVKWPSTLKTIGNKAFENHQMTSVELPANVTSIGSQAFRIYQEGLQRTLTTLVLNEGLKTIGKEAFTGSKITEVLLPTTLELSTKKSAASMIFGKSGDVAKPIVKFITNDKAKAGTEGEDGSFNTDYINGISHVVVYNKLAGTGWAASDFMYDEITGTLTGWSDSGQVKRQNLKTLVLPDQTPGGKDIVAIGSAAFKIPDDEVEITKFGINSPNGMSFVILPEKLTIVGAQAFSQNSLKEVDFTGIVSIGERAFYGNDLIEVNLPDTVTSLGDGAFATNDITELRLSAGVTVIPQGVFSMNICLANVTIPDTVIEIGTTAFAGARLTSLTIPKSVTKIGKKAFHLHHLSELVIPGNVKEIGESAFEGTYKATTLKKLTIEEGVEVIGKNAFKEALLETVHFPNSIKTIGATPFLNNVGKDGSHVVEITTKNAEHLLFSDITYEIRFIGESEKNPLSVPGADIQNTTQREPSQQDKAVGNGSLTGDEVNMSCWIALMILAAAGGTGAFAYRKKYNNKRRS